MSDPPAFVMFPVKRRCSQRSMVVLTAVKPAIPFTTG